LITKNLAYLYLQEKLAIIWDFIYLQFITNPWIAFGIEINPILLKILTISLIILIFYYHRYERKNEKKKKWKKLIDISFALILAWAIWNAYERVFNSNVIDFVWVKYFSVFNLADSFITIGAILYLYILYKNN
jgi:signal peptidase II